MRARRLAGGRLTALGGCLLGALLVSTASAHAASLGGLASSSLLAQANSTGAITSSFSFPAGTSLATTLDGCGNPWTVVGGAFVISSGGTAVSSSSGLVTATVPLCNSASVNEEAGGDIHSSGSSTFGIVVNAATGGRPGTAAIYNNSGAGTVQLQRIDASGALTTWAQVTSVGGGNTPRFLRLAYVNGAYQASVNNVVVLSYTISDPSTRAAVEAHNAIGIASVSDTKSSFDNFQGYAR
jgi:hypothetical protein